MFELLVFIGAGIGGFVLARDFVRRRLRFVDAVHHPLAPLLAGLRRRPGAWPLAAPAADHYRGPRRVRHRHRARHAQRGAAAEERRMPPGELGKKRKVTGDKAARHRVHFTRHLSPLTRRYLFRMADITCAAAARPAHGCRSSRSRTSSGNGSSMGSARLLGGVAQVPAAADQPLRAEPAGSRGEEVPLPEPRQVPLHHRSPSLKTRSTAGPKT